MRRRWRRWRRQRATRRFFRERPALKAELEYKIWKAMGAYDGGRDW